MQIEIKIVAFTPTTDPNHFVADVYVNGERIHCGTGVQTVHEVIWDACKVINGTEMSKAVYKIMTAAGYTLVPQDNQLVWRKPTTE